MTHHLRGKVSWFGGPDDEGVDADEDLALYWEEDQVALHPELFLSQQPEGTTGLARRLDPETLYIACRWNYDEYSKDELREMWVRVRAPATGKTVLCRPVDWGPHEDTNRIADVSSATLEELDIDTDDEVEVTFPVRREDDQVAQFPYPAIVISSGHGKYVGGASGIIDEVTEARDVVERVAEILNTIGVDVTTFHDNTSKDQSTNLHTIVDFHNAQTRDLDVSVHFNANVETENPMGTECLFLTQETLADKMAAAIATNGLKDRGPKERTDLYFLNHTDKPAILIEVCFVDSEADVDVYQRKFDEICASIANVLSGGASAPVA